MLSAKRNFVEVVVNVCVKETQRRDCCAEGKESGEELMSEEWIVIEESSPIQNRSMMSVKSNISLMSEFQRPLTVLVCKLS